MRSVLYRLTRNDRVSNTLEKAILKALIEERDRSEEGSDLYNDLTEEIQLLQNDIITADIMSNEE
jgi:hypothetical protein